MVGRMEVPTCKHTHISGVVTISHLPILRCTFCDLERLRAACQEALDWFEARDDKPTSDNTEPYVREELHAALEATKRKEAT